ncbi:MAG: hypothetical protein BWX92_03583 [Deltaproteobacteria bacterium ADurb.Bin135]|nr:MAG: hypothetical protein BWX92_03583 [Deltaproteobacteria bacterium ADurb.Bin135]
MDFKVLIIEPGILGLHDATLQLLLEGEQAPRQSLLIFGSPLAVEVQVKVHPSPSPDGIPFIGALLGIVPRYGNAQGKDLMALTVVRPFAQRMANTIQLLFHQLQGKFGSNEEFVVPFI